MGRNYTVVRYDRNRMDQYYDPREEAFVDEVPNLGYDSREKAEEVMFGLEKDSDYEYAVERVG